MADQISNLKEGETVFFTFPNSGIVFQRVPKLYMDRINKVTQEAVDTDFENTKEAGYKLTANIKRECDLTEELADHLLPWISSLARYHNDHSHPHHISEVVGVVHPSKHLRFRFKDLWANFQKKHEFHPHHIHGGVYSFVIWTKMPYKIEEEIDVFPKATLKCASMFTALYTDILGVPRSFPIPADESYEGIICLFPSRLGHLVYPFYTSEGFRIGVSGDLVVDIDETHHDTHEEGNH